MKRQIRQSCFETNSSSTHAICIATESVYDIPSSIDFGFGEFGWSFDKLSSRRERADYLYTCLVELMGDNDFDEFEKRINFIISTLTKNGVKDINFDDEPEICLFVYNGELHHYIKPKDGYVDHSGCALDFINKVCSDEKMLLDYLFSEKSFILTGNDNSDTDVEINVDYPHEEFYKGN